jgi:hypothetical protein
MEIQQVGWRKGFTWYSDSFKEIKGHYNVLFIIFSTFSLLSILPEVNRNLLSNNPSLLYFINAFTCLLDVYFAAGVFLFTREIYQTNKNNFSLLIIAFKDKLLVKNLFPLGIVYASFDFLSSNLFIQGANSKNDSYTIINLIINFIFTCTIYFSVPVMSAKDLTFKQSVLSSIEAFILNFKPLLIYQILLLLIPLFIVGPVLITFSKFGGLSALIILPIIYIFAPVLCMLEYVSYRDIFDD